MISSRGAYGRIRATQNAGFARVGRPVNRGKRITPEMVAIAPGSLEDRGHGGVRICPRAGGSGSAMSRLTTALIAVVLGIIAAGALFVIYDSLSAPVIVIAPGTTIAERPVTVTITGAVSTPGTYDLPPDARLVDAIAAAGGPRGDADHAAFNPARRVIDEEVIEIPALAPPTGTTLPAAEAPVGPAPTRQQVNINSADVAALDALPGVGPVIAARIVEYRAASGPFMSVDELARVDGISTTMVNELRDLITVGE